MRVGLGGFEVAPARLEVAHFGKEVRCFGPECFEGRPKRLILF